VIYVLASLPMGRLADRVNRKRLVITGATFWTLGATLCGLAPNFTCVLAARFLIGISEATLVPAAVSMIADAFATHRRGTAFGVFGMATVLGGPIGISIGGFLLNLANGGAFASWPFIASLAPWRTVLLLFGIAGLVAPLILLSVREPQRLEGIEPTQRGSASSFFSRHGRVLIPLYLGCGLLAVGDYGLISWAPSVLSRRFHWRPDEIGLAFGFITAAAGIAGSISGGTLSDFAERRKGLIGRFQVCSLAAAAAVCAALAVCGPSAYLVLAGVGLWVLISTIGGIGGLVAIQSAVPNQYRGISASVFTFCNTLLGYGCGPTLVALVTERAFRAPEAVGYAISAVVAPGAAIAAMLFLHAFKAYPRQSTRER
jgi:MFS family permease